MKTEKGGKSMKKKRRSGKERKSVLDYTLAKEMDSMWAEIYGKARASAASENNKIERRNKKYIIIKKKYEK